MRKTVLWILLLALLCAPIAAQARPLNEYGLDSLVAQADRGDPAAQAELGDRYLLARGGVETADAAAALRCYRLSAGQGNGYGLARLGWMYETGTEVEADLRIARVLYLRAARKSDGFAQGRLGWLYESGALGAAR